MTLQDWLDLLESAPELQTQGWRIDTALGRAAIRNDEDECPLCAWATLNGSTSGYKGAWHLALRDVFGQDVDFGEADIIADAADRALLKLIDPATLFARAYLLKLFNLQEIPCQS